MSYFVVGDIHGCSAQLSVLLRHENLYSRRRIVFLGDYVDIGPDSSAVIEQLVQFLHSHRSAVVLEGNHDFALKTFLKTGDFAAYAQLGGIATIRAYCGEVYGDVRTALQRAIPSGHRVFLDSLQTHLEVPRYLFSHAGYSPKAPLDRSRESMVLTSHQDLFTEEPPLRKLCICGHYFQRTRKPYISRRIICLDTGCGILKGPLTAALLPERTLIQVTTDLKMRTTLVEPV
jgi:calcineurin-like phosphoesterase family protein